MPSALIDGCGYHELLTQGQIVVGRGSEETILTHIDEYFILDYDYLGYLCDVLDSPTVPRIASVLEKAMPGRQPASLTKLAACSPGVIASTSGTTASIYKASAEFVMTAAQVVIRHRLAATEAMMIAAAIHLEPSDRIVLCESHHTDHARELLLHYQRPARRIVHQCCGSHGVREV